MKIIYIAKHGPQDNQDEDAITYALRKLGHEVTCFHEKNAERAIKEDADFVLVHKYEDFHTMARIKLPIVTWDFDAVTINDPHLGERNVIRRNLANAREKYSAICLHTDGDWVDKNPDKRIQLMQGADERYVGYGKPVETLPPILFTGTVGHGKRRDDHIASLQAHYGDQFSITGEHFRTKVHGRALANHLASVKVAIAPDGPNTHKYWSNRVYLTMGLGGFLIHPYCERLTEHYGPGDLVVYHSQTELIQKIDQYLEDSPSRELMRQRGHEVTIQKHLYRHRCEDLINIVKERVL